MSNILGSLLLITFCTLLSYWENKKYGHFITPFGVMVWPYTIIVLIINFIGKHYGFYEVSLESILFVVVSFFFFMTGGTMIITLFRNDSIRTDSKPITAKNISKLFDSFRSLFIFLSLISIISGIINFNSSINDLGWINFGSPEFLESYGSGWLSHVQNLSRLAFIFLVGDYIVSKKKYVLFLIVFTFLVIFVKQVKYDIFGIVLSAYFFCLLNNIVRFSIKKILLYILGVFTVFSVSYYIGFLVVGIDYTFAARTNIRLINLFFTYLFGGPIAFSEVYSLVKYPLYSIQEIIAVPMNLIRFMTGYDNFVDIIIHNWVSVSNRVDMFHISNVYGAVGMLYMYLGKYLTWLYMFFLGIFSYSLWGFSLKVRKYIGVQMAYSLIMAFLTVSFFDLYFNKLVTFESTAYMLVIPPVFLAMKNIWKLNLSSLKELYRSNLKILQTY